MHKKFTVTNKHLIIFLIVFVNLFAVLSFFKYSLKDETIYLQETLLISNLLKSGLWIGNYPVGTHGFLFKLPLAIIYMIFPPSTFWSTVYSGFISGLSIILLFKISRKFFDLDDKFSLLVCLLFMTSMQFINTTFSYLREPFVIFSLLLFIYLVLERKRPILLALSLLLVLDAKEHYFYLAFISYILYLGITLLPKKKYREFLLRPAITGLPALLYIVLMFKTALVPINIYNAYILGLIDGGFSLQIKQIRTGSASNINYKQVDMREIEKNQIRTEVISLTKASSLNTGYHYKLLGYFLKIFNPRIFGYLSIHIFIVTVSIFGAFYFLVKGNNSLKFISIFLLVNVFVYMLYYSHGRYLFPISPAIFLVFIKFMNTNIKNIYFVLILGAVLSFISYFFEVNFILIKLFLLLIFFVFFGLHLISKYRFKFKNIFSLSVLSLPFCIFGLTTGLIYLYTLDQGQIKKALLFGTDGEFSKIQSFIDSDDNVYINDNPRLFSFYRNNIFLTSEERYSLNETIKKKNDLKKFTVQKTFYMDNEFPGCKIPETDSVNQDNGINKIILIKSRISNYHFPSESCLETFKNSTKMAFLGKHALKNKDVYLFEMH